MEIQRDRKIEKWKDGEIEKLESWKNREIKS